MSKSTFDQKFENLNGFRITNKQLPELFNQKGKYWYFHKADFDDNYATNLDIWWSKDCYIPEFFVELTEYPYEQQKIFIVRSNGHFSWVDVFPAESKEKAEVMWRTCLD